MILVFQDQDPQIAAMLRLSVKTARLDIATGKLVGRKVGKQWLVTEDALRAFMETDRTAKASWPACTSFRYRKPTPRIIMVFYPKRLLTQYADLPDG